MKQEFKLEIFPDSTFIMEIPTWTTKYKLSKDNLPLEQSKEKGTPFLVPDSKSGTIKIFIKAAKFPDFMPSLEIDGKEHLIAPKLEWYEYVIGGVPILLLFGGGALGAMIGAVACVTNYALIRSSRNARMIGYSKVALVTLLAFFVFLVLAAIAHLLIEKYS